jgi:predicted permease
MRRLRAWFLRLGSALNRSSREQEFARELEANLQLHIDDNIRAGMTPDEARRAALIKFGSIDGTKEAVRDRRGIPVLETLARDVRYSLRVFLQHKGWSAVAVFSLALGIGANTAIFNAVNSLLLKQLPVSDPDRLVRLRWTGENDLATNLGDYGYLGTDEAGRAIHGSFSSAAFEAFRQVNQTMDGMLAFSPMGNLNVIVDGRAETARALVVSGDYFRVLGVRPALGRTIMPEDDNASAAPVAMISYPYWMSRFGGDPGIVSKTATVTGTPATIVGVTPADFSGVQQPGDTSPPEIILPLSHEPQFSIFTIRGRANQPTTWWLYMMGRLKPGATAPQVEGNLAGVFQQSARDGWNVYFKGLSTESQKRNADRSAVPALRVDSGSRGFYEVRPDTINILKVLNVVSGLIWLIVCANVANLLLSRATARQREISVRLSLGASRSRLVRQLLTESVMLALSGGALGMLVSYWSVDLMPWAGPLSGVNWRVFAFAVVASLATGILFGMAPALRATRMTLAATLKDNSRGVSRSRNILSKSLIVAQVAIALALLVSAGLLLRTLVNLRGASGLDARNLLVFRLNPLLIRYDQQRAAALYEQLTRDLEAVPGIQSVSVSDMWMLTGRQIINNIHVPALHPASKDEGQVHTLQVGPKFFQTMGISLERGRDFTLSDNTQSPKVAIVNEAAARKYFAGQDPIGFKIDLEANRNLEVAGIVRDAKYSTVREPAPPTVFLPFLQYRIASMSFEVRTAGDPSALMPAVREAIRRIDPELPVMSLSTHAAQIEESFAQERFLAQSYLLFGILASTLAAIGLFGVLSYGVERRTNEIGIRMAVGARALDVIRMVLRESLLLVLIGLAFGVAGSLAAGRLIASMLFGVQTADPLTFAVVGVAMMGICALAAYLPARRASRIDPTVALRHE